MIRNRVDRQAVSWALYDWANSAFATTVLAGFFPVFFKEYWSAGADARDSTFQLGLINSAGGIVVAILAPILGAIADAGRFRKRLLGAFAAGGILCTGLLPLVGKGDWPLAAALFVLGSVGFMGGNVFYDSLLVGVARGRPDFVSAMGYALGYLGGGVLFALNVAMVLNPSWFGLSDPAQAIKVAFLMVALWWALFSLPLFLWVREPPSPSGAKTAEVVRRGLAQLRDTLRESRHLRPIFTFLVAYWLYIDGVDTIIRMAVDYGLSIGLSSNDLILALLVTQFVGFPSALLFGKLAERIGAKRGIFLGIAVYIAVTVFAAFMDSAAEFFVLAAVIGLVQGGVQALSRSLYSTIIPKERTSEFFGFYNMLGKFAAVVGPALVGVVSLVAGARLSILAILLLFIGGALLLWRVDPSFRPDAAQNAGRAA